MSVDTSEWKVCVNLRKQKRDQRRIEKHYFPHLVHPQRAQQLQRKLNVDNLANALLGDEARTLQREGWIYTRVLRADDADDPPVQDGWEYKIVEGINKWGDRLLFRRQFDTEPEIN